MHEEKETFEGQTGLNDTGQNAAVPAAQDPASAKARILETFGQLLDNAFETSQTPDGIAPAIWKALGADYPDSARQDRQTDLYQLWSTLTVLSQEIKIQGRTFGKLSAGVESLMSKLTVLSEHEQTDFQQMTRRLQGISDEILKLRSQQFQEAQTVKQQAARAFVDVLIEMRERMIRGAESSRTSLSQIAAAMQQPMWLFKKRRQATVKRHYEMFKTLADGYMINLDRIEDILKQYDIVEIDCAGKLFDPLLMKAAALDDNAALPEGTIVEVFSRGYRFAGQVHRPAEVKVVRHINPQTLPDERL